MNLYLLDTNIASAAMRGDAGIDQRLAQLAPGQWCISAITRSELRFGVERKPSATRLARVLEAFLSAAEVAPWDTAAADAHGRLRAALQLRGTPIGVFDEMIGAHGLALGAVVVTDNTRHFARIPGLAIENWLRPSADH